MRLLIVDSAPNAERLVASLQECGGEITCCDPNRTSEIQAVVRQADADIVLLALAAISSPLTLWTWLEYVHATYTAMVLLIDEPSQLDALGPTGLAMIDDFALSSATPRELCLRLRQAGLRRAARLADAERLSDAEVKRAFAARLIQAQETERQLLSKELHDGIGQMMMVHFMDAEWLANAAPAGPLRDAAEALCKALSTTMQGVRDLAVDLRPPSIDELGIGPALESLVNKICRRAGIRYECTRHLFQHVPSQVNVAIYRIAQAALDNAVRHSRCKNIAVHLEHAGKGLQLRVIDDGIGFDPQPRSGVPRLGLMGMRERADAIGGRVIIDSRVGQGTIVTVVVPEILELLRE